MACYLRTYRRIWGLTQPELGKLLGGSQPYISRLENGERAPTIEGALACQVLFGLAPSAMFPQTYTLIEDKVMRKVYHLYLAVNNTTSLSALRKRELLSAVMGRSKTRFTVPKEA
jgi:transcriptional regulator with XRE-family HTH domain